MSTPEKQKFYHLQSYLNDSQATKLYEFLKNKIVWHAGIKSKSGPTRLAKSLDELEFRILLDDFPIELAQIYELIENYSTRKLCGGVYLNYYRDGQDWTPNHTHPGTTQMIISLGTTRTFVYGKKQIDSKNGDVLLFGSANHGIPKDSNIINGRISIAMFLV